MFDLGMAELLVIGVVALIVIGPKDLPGLFYSIGRFTARLRRMAGDFSGAMEQAARESGVSDVAKDVKAATSVKSLGLDGVNEAIERFEKWEPKRPKPTEDGAATSELRARTQARKAAAQEASDPEPKKKTPPATSAPRKTAPRKTKAKPE